MPIEYEEETAAEETVVVSDGSLPAEMRIGDTFTFGHYEQDNNLSNGPEPIEWQVLAVESGRVLVISRHGLDAKPYNMTRTDVTWETCSLRKWLNGEFLNSAFSSVEQTLIPQVTVKNPKNAGYGTLGGNSTVDRIFLLSIDEVKQYFSSDLARQCKATDYAKANGAFVNTTSSSTGYGYSPWWLRSPGYSGVYAVGVNDRGLVYSFGDDVDNTSRVVRPAMWLNR